MVLLHGCRAGIVAGNTAGRAAAETGRGRQLPCERGRIYCLAERAEKTGQFRGRGHAWFCHAGRAIHRYRHPLRLAGGQGRAGAPTAGAAAINRSEYRSRTAARHHRRSGSESSRRSGPGKSPGTTRSGAEQRAVGATAGQTDRLLPGLHQGDGEGGAARRRRRAADQLAAGRSHYPAVDERSHPGVQQDVAAELADLHHAQHPRGGGPAPRRGGPGGLGLHGAAAGAAAAGGDYRRHPRGGRAGGGRPVVRRGGGRRGPRRGRHPGHDPGGGLRR